MSKFNYYPPKSDFIGFESEEDLLNKLAEWGFNKSVRETVLYKDYGAQETVRIAGYEEYGEEGQFNTIVVEFPDGNLSCIHPAYLKEMQSPSFQKEIDTNSTKEKEVGENNTVATKTEKKAIDKPSTENKETTPKATKKPKAKKVPLPSEKVHFTASIKEFSTMYNHFKEAEEEIIILENVVIKGEVDTPLEQAWCSHSKTLKKLELEEESKLEFDAKVVDKKHKEVLYKINNPSKIEILK